MPPPDPAGLRYERHWQPVLAPAGLRLLDRVAAALARADRVQNGRAVRGPSAPARVLDLGTGTGALAEAAATRWPAAQVIGLDASAAMLSVARARAAGDGASASGPAAADRLEWLLADAAAMPLADGQVDLVLAAFVLHVVTDRSAVLREVARVLRPGGRLGLVGWLADDVIMAPDVAFDEAVGDLGLLDPETPDPVPPAGDFIALDEVADELAAAGFVDTEVGAEELTATWTRGDYLDFKVGFDEWDLFASLSARDADRLRERALASWESLTDDAFSLRAPLAVAVARRPG